MKIEYNGDTSAEGRGILTIKWRNVEVNKFIFFGIVLFWSMSASATLIGFEGVAPLGGIVQDLNIYSESGYDFVTNTDLASNTKNFRVMSNNFSGVASTTGDHGFIQAPHNIISITNSSSTLFSIQSLDAGILFSGLRGTLDVVGNLSNGNTVNTALTVINNGLFQNFVFDNTWTNLQSIDFTLSENSNFLGIDNVQLTTVPLPAAFWLLATGLLGLTGISKRKTV